MKKILIIFVALSALALVSCSRVPNDTTNSDESNYYDRFVVTNKQILNGTNVITIVDTAKNCEYVYFDTISHEPFVICTGEPVNMNEQNEANNEVVFKNDICNWSAPKPGGELANKTTY